MNKTDPLVSIIMPTYNVEQYISSAIESVLFQTIEDWELLIINDGATDKSEEIALKYADKDKRIKVISKENGGLSDARNYGLFFAKGKYVHFFDSDDTIVCEFYEKMVGAIGDNDFVICGYYKDYESHNKSISHEFHPRVIDDRNKSNLEFVTKFFDYAWNKLFSIEFIKKNNLLFLKGLSVIEDVEFMSRVIEKNARFCVIDFLGYRYKVRNQNTLGNSYREDLIECHIKGLKLKEKVLNYFCDDQSIINQDYSALVFNTKKWLLYCISNSNKLSFNMKYKQFNEVLHNNELYTNIDKIMKSNKLNFIQSYMMQKKQTIPLLLFYTLKNII